MVKWLELSWKSMPFHYKVVERFCTLTISFAFITIRIFSTGKLFSLSMIILNVRSLRFYFAWKDLNINWEFSSHANVLFCTPLAASSLFKTLARCTPPEGYSLSLPPAPLPLFRLLAPPLFLELSGNLCVTPLWKDGLLDCSTLIFFLSKD